MDKRERILDALQELLDEGRAGVASVSEIAKRAGIAKGGMYYYFKSKEEVFDALADRQYRAVIHRCETVLERSGGNALDKLAILLHTYRGTAVAASVDEHLHQVENAAIHQKSLVSIVSQLQPLVTRIIEQGNAEEVFACEHPRELAEVMLSVLVFLLDPGLFAWRPDEVIHKLKALSTFMEAGLQAPQGSFAFLYQGWSRQLLTDK